MTIIQKCQLLLLAFLSCSILFAQNHDEGYLYVYPNQVNAYPDGNNRSNSILLNTILDNYDVVEYQKSFPGAPASSFISNAYEMHLNGNVANFRAELEATNMFSLIEHTVYYSVLCDNVPSTSFSDTCYQVDDPYPNYPSGNPSFTTDWSLDIIDAECAWEITKGDPNIIVGVVDTEFDNDHPDLIGKLLPDVEMMPNAEAITIQNSCIHGTPVVGHIVAQPDNNKHIAGVAYNTRAAGYVIRATANDDGCFGNPWPGVWQAGFTDNRPVMNISWGGIGGTAVPLCTTTRECVRLIIETGTLMVFGAGNWEADDPANAFVERHGVYNDIPGVVIVSSIGLGGRHRFSNGCRYPAVDLCAPGRTLNLLIRGGSSYTDQGGTSNSAPFVAGAAALCLDVNPCLTPPELEEILKATTDPIEDRDSFPGLLGTGYLNVYKAVLAASGKLPSTTITTTETWDYTKRVDGVLTVAAGAELTIKSSVYFAYDSKIVVEPGGRLIVDGGHLKKDCDNEKFWEGIEVKGVSSASQFPFTNQGYVELNDATIEEARIAVSLFNRATYTQGGGIVRAVNTDFINCQTGIAAAKYDNFLPTTMAPFKNMSHILHCNFDLNDLYVFENGDEHIFLDRVGKITISNCVLSDSRTSIVDEADLQSGIRTSNAKFSLRSSTLSNMKYGVKAENVKSASTFKLSKNEFLNNFYGVSIRAVDAFDISDNVFEIGGFAPSVSSIPHPERHTGVFVDHSTAFFLRDNEFSASANTAVSIEPVGVAVNATNVGSTGQLSADRNTIYRNTFTNLYRANVANGNNIGDDPILGGLRYFCNENITNSCTDFTVFDGSIAFVQATLDNKAAGNIFTQDDSCNSFSDFDNTQGNFITYHYFDGNASEEPIFTTSAFSKIIGARNFCTDDDSPGPIEGGGKEDQLAIEYATKNTAYLALRQQYYNMLDGGDTENLKDLIDNMTAFTRPSVYQQLMNIAPYLSTNILSHISDNTLFSNAQKAALLSANPESVAEGLNNQILNILGFSVLEQNNVTQAANTTTTRTQLESDLRTAYGEMQAISHTLHHFYLFDQTDEGVDYMTQATWAGNAESVEGYMQSIDIRLKAADYTAMQAEIAALEAMDMSAAMQDQVDNFKQLKLLEQQLAMANQPYEILSPLAYQRVQYIATTDKGKAGVQAQNWLSLIDDTDYQKAPRWGSSTTALQDGGSNIENNITSMTPKTYVAVKPNPSSDLFTFSYTAPDKATRVNLSIYDINGKLLFEQALDVETLQATWQPNAQQAAGVYFYQLRDQNGQHVQQGRLVYMGNK